MKHISFVLILALVVGIFLHSASVAAGTGYAAPSDPEVYIVVHQSPALATYGGGIAGLAATSPEARGELRLDPDHPDSQAYLSYLDQQHALLLSSIEAAIGHPVEALFRYRVALNGMALRLTSQEAATVATLPGVAHVEQESYLRPLTDKGPAWIGAMGIWDGSQTRGLPGTQGEGIVVGIIDTGVNPDHPSFADPGPVDGFDHTNPRIAHFGVCAPQNPLLCNDKLIGMYDFTTTGPEDDVLHGSHVASTVAGNVVDAELLAPTLTFSRRISGVAPHANIISYKVCSSFEFPELGSCPLSALLAGIDQATVDIVDVINFSIGGEPFDPWADPLAQAFFGARAAGIFVATSAGNSGPGAATVGRPANAPWVTSVAASTHDRKLANALVDMAGGATAPPADISGKSLTSAYGPASIVYAGDFGDALCLNPFPAGTWTNDEIVVCDRGVNGRLEKAENAAAGGAGGYVLANDALSGDSVVADAYVVPGVHIGYDDSLVLIAWLDSGSGHTASIAGTVSIVDPANGDIMAGFSSRGPNVVPSIIKPDVTAPGVDIFAAFHTPDPANPGPPEFGIISGTSMSSPHTAGAGALLRALHPDWSPDQVRSALMTTAFTSPTGSGPEVHPVLKEDETTPADPFDMGAGRIDLSRAGRVGLLLDETPSNYLVADPGAGGDPSTLNLPSMANSDCRQTCSWTRNLASTQNHAVTWTASVDAPPLMGLTVTPAAFTLGSGGAQTISVTADASALQPRSQWYFATVTLSPDDPSLPAVHLPVGVFAGIERRELHFHGNIHDGCTGHGVADIDVCNGPFLLEDPNLDTALAATWGPVPVVLSCTPASEGRCESDPSWVWYLNQATSLEGPMTVQWWYSCPACNLALATDFDIRLWADGVLAFEQTVRIGISAPAAPRLLRTTLFLPRLSANETFVLNIDPVFLNQDQSSVYYDSTLPCPGAAAGPCDSLVLMPVVEGTPPPPVMEAPFQHPIADDDPPDQVDGVDRDGNYHLSWEYPPPPSAQPCAFRVEEATFMETIFFDDAQEALVLGSNSRWTGDQEWNSALHPNTGSLGYSVLYTDEIDAALTLAAPLLIPAGVNATLSFASFENIEPGFDFGYVEVSADGGPFVTLAAFTGLFSGERTLDLSGFAGQSILLRFRFDTDPLVFFAVGWVIDDIRIEIDNFTPIGTVDRSTRAFDVTGRASGDYLYRIVALGGDCANTPVAGPPSNVEAISVERQTGTDSATGGGWLGTIEGKKINFGFDVERSAAGTSGSLELNDKQAGVKIALSQITSLGDVEGTCGSVSASGSSLEINGSGTFNGTAASFRACFQDNGEPGHSGASPTPDTFYLECTVGCSYNMGDRTPDDGIDAGNIDVARESGAGAGEPEATTIILDPLLLSQGLAGQAQIFTVTVYDQYQGHMASALVTLTRTAADGSVETLTAFTDLAGTVVFSTLNLGQTVEYIAASGSVQSNAIELDPLLE